MKHFKRFIDNIKGHCPNCFKLSKDKDIDLILIVKNYKRLNNYVSQAKQINLQCIHCNKNKLIYPESICFKMAVCCDL